MIEKFLLDLEIISTNLIWVGGGGGGGVVISRLGVNEQYTSFISLVYFLWFPQAIFVDV